MQLAVLGTDPQLMELVAAACQSGHTIIWISDVRPVDAESLSRYAPDIVPTSNWEVLLDQATADAVLVGRGTASDELRTEQLRRLATDAIPLLVTHPIGVSVLAYYELDMLRRQSRGVLRHYNPTAENPYLEQLACWLRDERSPIGPIHQIGCERRLADVGRATVLDALARDAELLRTIAGRVYQVSAIGPRSADEPCGALQVQMTTSQSTTLRWSVAPALEGESDLDVSLLGTGGVAKLTIREQGGAPAQAWQLETNIAGKRISESLGPYLAAEQAISELSAVVAEQDADRRQAQSNWEQAVHAMELVDAVELSLQKGRTIDVHQQQLTEQLAFRGTMAALGCGLLLVGLGVVIVAALLGGIESLVEQRKLMGAWPIVVLAILAFFLLLQTMPMLAAKPRRTQSPDETQATTRD